VCLLGAPPTGGTHLESSAGDWGLGTAGTDDCGLGLGLQLQSAKNKFATKKFAQCTVYSVQCVHRTQGTHSAQRTAHSAQRAARRSKDRESKALGIRVRLLLPLAESLAGCPGL
jgi:hypothetical protein